MSATDVQPDQLAPVPSHPPRRLVFAGTPDMAVPALVALVDAGFDIALVVTRPDKRRGRGGELSPSPVKAAAERLGLPVGHDIAEATEVGADLGVVVAFGQLIRTPVLSRLAFVNLHFSLLPRWRGAAPVERALLAGDDETGVDLMAVEPDLDTGAIFARRRIPIRATDTLSSLRAVLVEAGCAMLVEELRRGLGVPVPQVGEPTYAAKISPSELEIDWSRPAGEIERLVRLGGAWTTFRGRRLKVLSARMEEGGVVPLVVQPEGKAAMSYVAWSNGARPGPGEKLGS